MLIIVSRDIFECSWHLLEHDHLTVSADGQGLSDLLP